MFVVFFICGEFLCYLYLSSYPLLQIFQSSHHMLTFQFISLLITASCEGRCSNEFHRSSEEVSYAGHNRTLWIYCYAPIFIFDSVCLPDNNNIYIVNPLSAFSSYFYCFCFHVFRADKIPAAQYSSYVESCQRQRQQDGGYLHNAHLMYTEHEHDSCNRKPSKLKQFSAFYNLKKSVLLCLCSLAGYIIQ